MTGDARLSQLPEPPRIRYRCTDLFVMSPVSLEPLRIELEHFGLWGVTHVNDDGVWDAMFQAHAGAEPDAHIAGLLDGIEELSASGRAIWNTCFRRDFDVAYDCGEQPRSVTHEVSINSLRRMAEAGGVLKITIYPHDPDDVP
ncbi:MAG: hypothetical protein JNG89_12635 [Planctomycetaceae bacterium]|nr:hypothetical protein [Planctomycetaceae bacterium]